jgi:hypothetical protein
MPKFTLSTPDWSKTFDNYRKYSVPTGAGADDNTTIKVPVFDTGNLEAALYWRKQFADLIDLKQLFEFQELLQSYGIRSRASSTANPQSNSILERTHQVIANQLRSLILMSIKLKSLADIQHELLAPVQWAMNATYHTTLQATAGQLAFQRDMILPTSFLAHWQNIRQRRQTHTDRDTARENQRRIPYRYSVGDLVLIRQPAQGKLAKPTRGPFHIIDVSRQHVNGTVLVDLNHSQESFNINIRRLIPFQRRQPH